jgi:pyrroline-5-carboxylate reductase
MRLGAIGAGHMGGAVLRAVLAAGLFPPERVHISSPVPSELEPFARRGCRTSTDNAETVRNAELVLLAVRPNQVAGAVGEIAGLTEGKCLLSIAAGVTVSSIRKLLPAGAHVIRVMPNLPLTLGAGATVMAKPIDVPERFVEAARAVFARSGIVEELDESLINAATALGGSAVAYFFRVASVMSSWAGENGISYEAALRITAQTMLGASKMLTESGKTPGELADGVAVPGGTTEAAFRAFGEAGFDEALRAGMEGCKNRADALN